MADKNNLTSIFETIKDTVTSKGKLKSFAKENTVYLGLAAFAYFLLILLSCHISIASIQTSDSNLLSAFFDGLNHFMDAPFNLKGLSKALPEFFRSVGITTVIYLFVALWLKIDKDRRGKTMIGKEAGTAEWNKDLASYNKRFSDPPDSTSNNGPYNMILTQDVHLNLNSRVTRRNNNVCVVGGSGSGKSRFFVKPNILQANTNYVITDPSGELLASTGDFLRKQGYEIKIFNLVEMAKSDCYNPFNYIRDDLGVLMMINCLIQNTNPPGQKSGDPFWEKSETALLQALCFYLIKYRPKSDQNFSSVMKLLRLAEINEQNPNAKSELDILFEEVKRKDPNSIALKQYLTFKMGAGRTLKSILISCSVRLTVFNLRQIESLTGRDTIDLASMGTGKKALFVIIPAADSTYNFLVSMMYSQLFETLYFVAETREGTRLETPVRFLLDEFANIGQIPEFNKKLATMRKYEISCNIILQNLAQIKTMYKDDWQTMIGNCDSFLFLGGQEYDTLDYISKELGDQTITALDSSRSHGKSGSSSQSRKRQGRKLMFADEIGRLDDSECILIIRGLKPFLGKKYEYTKHPNYKYTGDADSKLIYVNTMDNTITENKDNLEQKYAESKVLAYTKAMAMSRPDTKILGDIKSIQGLAKTLNLKNAEELFSRFTFIPPDPLTETTAAIVAEKEKKEEEFVPNIKIFDYIKKNTIEEKITDLLLTSNPIKNIEDKDKETENITEENRSLDEIIEKKQKEKELTKNNDNIPITKNGEIPNVDSSYMGDFVKKSVSDSDSSMNSAEEWIFPTF